MIILCKNNSKYVRYSYVYSDNNLKYCVSSALFTSDVLPAVAVGQRMNKDLINVVW